MLRPLLDVAKTRLLATLRQARIPFADDPSNRDPRFLRARLRKLAPGLEREGIDAAKLSLLARRLARANAAIEQMAAEEWKRALRGSSRGALEFDARSYFALPAEIALRLLGRAIDDTGHEGPAELRKLEALQEALADAHAAQRALKRTLAGAVIELDGRSIHIDSAPADLRADALTVLAKSAFEPPLSLVSKGCGAYFNFPRLGSRGAKPRKSRQKLGIFPAKGRQ